MDDLPNGLQKPQFDVQQVHRHQLKSLMSFSSCLQNSYNLNNLWIMIPSHQITQNSCRTFEVRNKPRWSAHGNSRSSSAPRPARCLRAARSAARHRKDWEWDRKVPRIHGTRAIYWENFVETWVKHHSLSSIILHEILVEVADDIHQNQANSGKPGTMVFPEPGQDGRAVVVLFGNRQ